MNNYKSSLDSVALKRYEEKCELVGNVDPYELDPKTMSSNPETFAKICFGDLHYYLVFGTSSYTLQDFKAYKSLQAYNQFVCGWVKEVVCADIAGLKVFLGKVMHSQRLSEKPAVPWVIAEENGVIRAAHCTCMAGLGEACTHVAAILFYVEHAVRVLQEKGVTDVAAYWGAPSLKKVDPAPVDEIDFSTPLAKMRKLRESELPGATPMTQQDEGKEFVVQPKRVPTPDATLLDNAVFSRLQAAGVSSALFLLMPKYAPEPQPLHQVKTFSTLFDEALQEKSLHELQTMAVEVDISITDGEAAIIERETRRQSKSKTWFKHRAGRITASRFKEVCSTNCEKPSISLVRAICYPEEVTFVSKATKWGCTHEKVARQQYKNIQMQKHRAFKVEECGLLVNPQYPHFGASPDGLVWCDCCDCGCLEIKCPLCYSIDSVDKKSCLTKVNNELILKREHSYYFQVQAQLFVSGKKYCDFVVWTEKSVFVERIFPCEEFWVQKEAIATEFFAKVILPELMGKVITRNRK